MSRTTSSSSPPSERRASPPLCCHWLQLIAPFTALTRSPGSLPRTRPLPPCAHSTATATIKDGGQKQRRARAGLDALVAIDCVDNVAENSAHRIALRGKCVQPGPHAILLIIRALHQSGGVDALRQVSGVVDCATVRVDSSVDALSLRQTGKKLSGRRAVASELGARVPRAHHQAHQSATPRSARLRHP